MIYNYIIHPITKQKVKTYSSKGKLLLKFFIKKYNQSGGSLLDDEYLQDPIREYTVNMIEDNNIRERVNKKLNDFFTFIDSDEFNYLNMMEQIKMLVKGEDKKTINLLINNTISKIIALTENDKKTLLALKDENKDEIEQLINEIKT